MNPIEPIMKVSDKMSDLVALGYGYVVSDPDMVTISKITTLLNTEHLPISQGALDEIAKLFAGVVVAVISRFAFAAIERFKAKKEKRKAEQKEDAKAKPATVEPKNINLNNQK